jgi:hypothetical protein
VLAVKTSRDRHDASHKPDDGIRLRLDLRLAAEGHSNARDNQERAEHVDDPMKVRD